MDGVSDVRSGGEGVGGNTSTRVGRKRGWAIAGAMEREIKRCADAGVPFPTFRAIAKRHGASAPTVSRTLWDLVASKRVEIQNQKFDWRYRVLPDGAWTAWRRDVGPRRGGRATLADCGVKALGTTVTGMTRPWSGLFMASGANPRELTISGDLAVTGKVSSPQPDLPTILRDRREALVTQRDKIGLAIEHIDGLLHFLAPEGDGSEVEKTA